jgi:hypothetical protein
MALIPAVVAAVLSYGATVSFIVAIVNCVLSYFAINTILNLGRQQETGEMIDAFETYKSRSVVALTITWIIAIVLIVLTVL